MARNIILLISVMALMFLTGCSSPYIPEPHVVEASKFMSDSKAFSIVENTLTPSGNSDQKGICKTNGWNYDTQKGPAFKVDAEGITYDSFKAGKFIKEEMKGSLRIRTYERIVFRGEIKFSEIDWIRIFKTSSFNRICYIPENHTDVRFSLSTGLGHWFAVVVPNSMMDDFIAALMKLAPNVPIQNG